MRWRNLEHQLQLPNLLSYTSSLLCEGSMLFVTTCLMFQFEAPKLLKMCHYFFFSCFYLKSYLNCTVNGGCRTFPHKMSHLRGSSEVFFTSELDFLEMTGGKMRKYWMKHMGPFFTWEKTFLQQRNSPVVQRLVQVSVHHIHEFFLIFTGTRIVSVDYWFPQF